MLSFFSPPPTGNGIQGSCRPPFTGSDAAALGSLFLPLRRQPLLSLFLRSALLSLAPAADPWRQSAAGIHAGDAGQGLDPLSTCLSPFPLLQCPSPLYPVSEHWGGTFHYPARREFFASGRVREVPGRILNSDNVEEAARDTDGYFIKSGIVTVIKDALIPSGTVI
ncbi:Uncharacterized protein TCM_044791 [Theobroma cacao]|uniref:Uncharacterized protein n=1 Tax=Theobroma cacao TaxID=3641 RepID=A0A061FS20_THECC|nr:Uncharacterized protein TCM_044791 [Theobroma cacao]